MKENEFTFTVNGENVEPRRAWVHLKRPARSDYAKYCCAISGDIASSIFGTHKPEGLPWVSYVKELVHEFGTFMMDGYIAELTSWTGKRRGPFDSVIISVDEVFQKEDMIWLTGKAERFDGKLGVLRSSNPSPNEKRRHSRFMRNSDGKVDK